MGRPLGRNPAALIRKFSEFTWDFLLYTLIDFHPVLAVVDISVLLTGPLYNRRLKKQLRGLADSEMTAGARAGLGNGCSGSAGRGSARTNGDLPCHIL